MFNIEDLQRDPAKTEEGTWVTDIPNLGDVALRVRGMSSPAYIKAHERLMRKVPSNLRDRDGSPIYEERLRLIKELLHTVVLLDWKGIAVSGKEVKYDPELAKHWCTDPRFARFGDAVVYAAGVVDRGVATETGEALGN